MYLRNLGKAIESVHTTKETTRALSDCQEEVEEGYIITSYTPETEVSSVDPLMKVTGVTARQKGEHFVVR